MPPAKEKHVEALWLSFEKNVIPVTASDIQRKEMRRAFYSGAWALLQEMKRLGEDDISEEVGADILEAVDAECCDFMNRIGTDY
jgi:hypothetical protein